MRATPSLLVLALLLAILAPSASANGTVRAHGMADATTALVRGVDATVRNAANLGMPDNPGASVEIFATGARLANDAIDLDLYNRTSGATLDDADRRALLDAIPHDGMNTTARVDASVMGLQWGRMALSVTGRADADGNLPHDVFALLLEGNAEADSVSFEDARAEALALASVNLAGAVTFGAHTRQPVHLGLTLRYLRGIAYARLDEISGSLVTDVDGIRGQALAQLTTAGAGEGMGFDLSVATQLSARWQTALVLENAWARIHFDRDLEIRRWVASTDTVSLATLEEVDDTDELFADEEIVEEGRPFAITLPRVLHLALGRHGERSALGVEWTQGFERRAGSTTTPRVALGGEWRGLGWLPLRCGLALGGATGRSASAGLGLALGGFRLDLAAATHGEWWPGDPKGLSLAVGSGLRF